MLVTLLPKDNESHPGALWMAEKVVTACMPCIKVNANHHKAHDGQWLQRDQPALYWETDITEVKPARYGNKYLLVFIDYFSGLV